jgi:cell wall-associated NlpC family hydrolase
MRIPFASDLSFLHSADGLIGKNRIVYEGTTIEAGVKMTGDNRIREIAFTFLNTPYQWGGRSVFGVDCSGFTQVVYKCIGLKLLRDASQQATQGEVVGFLQEVKCGDLAFFDNEAGKITHVGILLDLHTIIHASGKVRVDRIDNFGIVNSDTEKRTHTLRVIKRIGE